MLPLKPELITAILAIILHVINYNFTARIEHSSRIFTKIMGQNAIYIYALCLVASALVRDHYIQLALKIDSNSFQNYENLRFIPMEAGFVLFVFGVLLNLWTLKALGIKGMYNGDSFGYLMDAPVTNGPFKYFSDPQYFGTTVSLLGSAIYYQSVYGLMLTAVLYLVFLVSVEVLEKPHLDRLYAKKK